MTLGSTAVASCLEDAPEPQCNQFVPSGGRCRSGWCRWAAAAGRPACAWRWGSALRGWSCCGRGAPGVPAGRCQCCCGCRGAPWWGRGWGSAPGLAQGPAMEHTKQRVIVDMEGPSPRGRICCGCPCPAARVPAMNWHQMAKPIRGCNCIAEAGKEVPTSLGSSPSSGQGPSEHPQPCSVCVPGPACNCQLSDKLQAETGDPGAGGRAAHDGDTDPQGPHRGGVMGGHLPGRQPGEQRATGMSCTDTMPPPSIPLPLPRRRPSVLVAAMEDVSLRIHLLPPALRRPLSEGHPPRVHVDRPPCWQMLISGCGSCSALAATGHLSTGCGWESSAVARGREGLGARLRPPILLQQQKVAC